MNRTPLLLAIVGPIWAGLPAAYADSEPSGGGSGESSNDDARGGEETEDEDRLAQPRAASDTSAKRRSADGASVTESDEEIVVTGSRTQTTRAESVVTTLVVSRRDIEESGATTVAEALQAQPGVVLERSYAGTSVRLQGLNPEHTLVLVDGQRVSGRKAGQIDLSRYPVDWVERIEIVKGPTSVLYGSDAMGGVVNLITRKADGPFSADVYSSYGSLNAFDLSAGVATEAKGVGVRAHGGYHTTDSFDRNESTLTTDGPARTSVSAGAISTVTLAPDWTVTPRVYYRQQDSQGISETGSGAIFDQRNLTEEVQGAVATSGSFTGTDRLQATGFSTWYRDQYSSNQRNSSALDSYQDTTELSLQGAIQYDRLIGENNRATIGVDTLAESMESDRLATGEGERTRVGVFAQDEWTVTQARRLTIMPGGRFDSDSQFGTHATPSIALRYDPLPTIAIRGGYGWGYRAPVFKELLMRFENRSANYVVEGNKALKPERSRNAHLGIDWIVSRSLWTSISAYRNDVVDLIGFGTLAASEDGSPTRYGYINVAEAVTQGGEINVEARLWAGLDLAAGYALNDTLDVANDRPLEGRSLHRVTAQLRQVIEATGTTATARLSWNGPKAYFVDIDDDDVEERVESDATTILDLRIFQDLVENRAGLRLFVGADNFLNTGDSEYFPLPPRTFFAGLTGRFDAT